MNDDTTPETSIEAVPYRKHGRLSPLERDEQALQELERGYKDANSGAFVAESPAVEVVEKEAEGENTSVSHQTQTDKYKKVDWQKRYSDLKRHYDKKLNEFRTQLSEAQSGVYKAPKTAEEIEQFKTQYRDLYEIVESLAHSSAEEKVKSMQTNMEEMAATLAKIKQEKAVAMLDRDMPAWRTITSSSDFQEWATEQPEEIQNWVFNNPDNASLAIKAIKLYQADKGITATEKKTSVKPNTSAAEAVSVRSKTEVPIKGKKTWTTSEIANLSLPQYEKLSKEIDLAFIEGRVVGG